MTLTTKIKLFTATMLASMGLALATPLGMPTAVFAQDAEPTPTPTPESQGVDCSLATNKDKAVCAVCQLDPTTPGCTTSTSAQNSLVDVAKQVINVLTLIVGITSVIVIVISGFRFITSSGDQQQVQGARNGIIYAIVGLVIVAFAQAIVVFVLNRVD